MRNLAAVILFFVLLIIVGIATYYHIAFGNEDMTGMFMVTAMTALGTCGVTVLSLFPYVPKDVLEPELYMREDGQIMLRIHNKTSHTTYIGSDRHDTSIFREDFAFWYPGDVEITFDNAHTIYTNPGDNLAVPPYLSIYYPINKKIFGKCDVTKIKMQVRTSSGYIFDVKNKVKFSK
jgi:hypothetical protein